MEWHFESADQIYPSQMRREVIALLHAHGSPDSDFASAELIYGELVSNVIRHARGRVRVRLDWNGDFPELSVIDEEPHEKPAIQLPPDLLAESGRGLFIVAALAKTFTLVDAGDEGGRASATLPVRRRPLATS